jgi:methyltransferase (TIGR00027 family)
MEVRAMDDLGRTALGTARIRAAESARPDRLFDDPLAAAFLAADPDAVPDEAAGEVGAAFAAGMVVRTRLLDDESSAAAAAGCRQVVLLGAGLDTRAFRLGWPAGTRVFELDRPDVVAFKERVLADLGVVPRCGRVAVPVDLAGEWATPLVAAGFSAARPTLWLPEGLLTYLSATDAARLFETVTGLSAPGSRLAFEHGGSILGRAAELPKLARYARLWRGGLGERTRTWLDEHGWRTELRDGGHLGRGTGVGALVATRLSPPR